MRAVPDALVQKLVAAADSFAASFEDTRMEDIAQASGIPRATLYYYFAGKEEILAFLLNAMLANYEADRTAASDDAGDTSTRLTELIRSQLGYLAANPAIAQLLLANLGKAGKLPDIAAEVRRTFHMQFEWVLGEGIEKGELSPCDVVATSTALFGGVMMVGLDALLREGDLDVERFTAVLHELFWRGLTAESADAKTKRSDSEKRSDSKSPKMFGDAHD